MKGLSYGTTNMSRHGRLLNGLSYSTTNMSRPGRLLNGLSYGTTNMSRHGRLLNGLSQYVVKTMKGFERHSYTQFRILNDILTHSFGF
jgi:hypothetical protein